MLASLLPGLRDVRAPFVSGALVLAAAYLFFSGPASDVTSSSARSENLDQLVSWLGRPGLAAAASLTAYLVGSLVVTVIRALIKRVNYRTIYRISGDVDRRKGEPMLDGERNPWSDLEDEGPGYADVLRHESRDLLTRTFPFFPYTYDSVRSLHEALTTHVSGCEREVHPGTIAVIMREVFKNGARRLRLASGDLHADFDRSISEAELRDGLLVSLPPATVAVLANLAVSGWIKATILIFSVVLVAVLFAQARRNDREAFSLLLGAVADHTVSTRSLDELDWTPR